MSLFLSFRIVLMGIQIQHPTMISGIMPTRVMATPMPPLAHSTLAPLTVTWSLITCTTLALASKSWPTCMVRSQTRRMSSNRIINSHIILTLITWEASVLCLQNLGASDHIIIFIIYNSKEVNEQKNSQCSYRPVLSGPLLFPTLMDYLS